MVNSLENIDKSKVSADRIEGLNDIIETEIGNTLTGAVSTITTSDLTADKVLVSNSNGKVAASSVTNTELGYVSGVTSSIQTQLGNKANDSSVVHKTGDETIDGEKTFNDRTNFVKYIYSGTTEINSGVTAQKTNVTKGTTPTDNYNNRFLLQSKDGVTVNQRLAALELFYDTDNKTSAMLSAYKPEFNSTTRAGIGVYYPASGDPYTYAPTPATSDNSTKIATTAYVKAQGYAVDSGVVHTSGDESIAGNKTLSGTTAITGQLQSKRNNNDARILNYYANYTKGTAPSATQYSGIKIVDKAGTEIGDFYGRISTGNTNSAYMSVRDPGTGTTTKQIAIHYPANGTAYTEAPTPATDDNSTKIATTAWVNNQGYAVDSDVVHTSGNETVGGTKTFTANQNITRAKPVLQFKDTSITRGTAPSAAVNSITINGLDNAGKNTWGIYHTWGTDKKAQTQLICYKGTTTDSTWAGIGVGYDSSGNVFTNAPTPATNDNSTKIATTAYVKSNLTALLPIGTIIPFAGSSTPSGFLKCDGSAVSRTTYSSLYSAIGTIYGTGNGSTTFNLPNGSNRSLWGNSRNKAISSGAPDITGNYNHQCLMNYGTGTEEGALYTSSGDADAQYAGGTGGGNTQTIGFKASKSNSIYGATTYIRPQSIGIVFFIKY